MLIQKLNKENFKNIQNEPLDIVLSGGGLKVIWAGSFLENLITQTDVKNIYTTSAGSTIAYTLYKNIYKDFIDFSLEQSKVHKHIKLGNLIKFKNLSGFQTTFNNLLDFIIPKEKGKNGFNVYFNTLSFKENGNKLLNFYRNIKKQNLEFASLKSFNLNELEKYNLKNLINNSNYYNEDIFETHLLQFNEKALRNALLATGAIPPFVTGLDNFQNRIDGGLISPLPLHIKLAKNNDIKKVLLIGNHEIIIKHGIVKSLEKNKNNLKKLKNLEIYYITPEEKIPVSMWGYKESENIIKTYEIGHRTFKTVI